jgi:hypothetical protein
MENTYQTFFRFKCSLNQLFFVFSIILQSAKLKIDAGIVARQHFLLLCNENIHFNRVKNIVFVSLSQGYLIKEIENIFPVFL